VKVGKTTLLKYLLPSILQEKLDLQNQLKKDKLMEGEPMGLRVVYIDLEFLRGGPKQGIGWEDSVAKVLVTELLTVGIEIAEGFRGSPSSIVEEAGYVAERNNFFLLFQWDEVQHLCVIDPRGNFKQVISNLVNRNMFHVVSGSGMAMVWQKFNEYSVSGHSIMSATISTTIHVPYKGNSVQVMQALRFCDTHKLKDGHLEQLLNNCPLSAAGVAFYVNGAILTNIQTVRVVNLSFDFVAFLSLSLYIYIYIW
jgi:hypothetical protein